MIKSFIRRLADRLRLNARATRMWILRVFNNEEKERTHLWRYLGWHLKEILCCALLAYLLTRVDKVQHFFDSFAQDIKSQTLHEPFWRFSLILTGNAMMIFWLSFVFWHKPVALHLPKLFGKKMREGFQRYYQKPGGTWRVATVSSIPFLLVDVALSQSLLKKDLWSQNPSDMGTGPVWLLNNPGWVALGGTVIFFLLCTLLRPRTRHTASLRHRWKILRRDLMIFSITIFGITWLLRNYNSFDNYSTFNYLIILLFIFVPPIVTTFILNGFGDCLIKERSDLRHYQKNHVHTHKTKWPKSLLHFNRAYSALQTLSYSCSIVIFLLVNNPEFTVHQWYSDWMFPLAMLLFVFIAYYQVVDILVFNVTPIRFSILVIVLICSILLFGRRDHYNLKFNGEHPMNSHLKRVTMESYFLPWAADRYLHRPEGQTQPDTAYLAAIEGGGSRSGAWATAVLTRLDSLSNGKLRRNCFAISSVSGGSIGAASTLALWDNANERGILDSTLYTGAPSKRRSYVSTIFKRNYLSTALAGMFFYDLFQQIPVVHWAYLSHASRTDRHQNEESNAVDIALKSVFNGTFDCRSDYLKKTNFLSLYYSSVRNSQDQVLNTRLPLFFPNTCRVEDGRRGIVSPIQMEQTGEDSTTFRPFIAAVDVIGNISADPAHANKYISLGEATSLSELFPYVNATVYAGEKAGTFMDGGTYENLGLTTLYEVRTTLRNILQDASLETKIPESIPPESRMDFLNYLHAMKFRILTIYYYYNHGQENGQFPNQSSQLLNPLIALLNTPFSGHTDYIYHKTRCEFPGEMVDIPLIRPDYSKPAGRSPEIVMSRWLSKYEISNILREADKIKRKTVDGGR
jgi:hypothetical protein